MGDVRAQVLAGSDARVTPVAKSAGLPPSTLYSLIARGEVASRKVGACVVLPNAEARRILGLPEAGTEGIVRNIIAEAHAA